MLVTRIVLILFSMLGVFNAYAQESIPRNVSTFEQFPTLLSKAQQRQENIGLKKSEGDIVYKSFRQLERDERKGIKHYKKGDYKKAYEVLSELAQWGLKNPQAILGTMYLHGQHVDQSYERGLGWLGVAKEVDNKGAEKSFNHVYQQLSAEQKTLIDQLVATQIEKFGVEAQNIRCKKMKPLGSSIKEMVCVKKPGTVSPWHSLD